MPKPPKFPGSAACLALMRKRDPMTQEEGFHFLLPHAADYVEELMAEFSAETDHGLRCWLLELIGEARSPQALSLFTKLLDSPDEPFRLWAVRGLERMNTKEARRALWERSGL